ncbi:MAG TPA: O-antigen ligase family protein [Solirubrobacteraceae bacterium]|nr:O-antigen ligase family protein [Solirubrobacteraceae bacterium]
MLPRASASRRRLWGLTLATAAAFCAITFYAKGGLQLESTTTVEIALTLGAGVIVAAAVLLAPRGARGYGAWPAGLLLAFTALSALSIVWSVQPDYSWQDAGRLLAYSGVFAAGVALVRILPERFPAILGGLALAAVVVCGYSLASKVFPASLDPADAYARLNQPYGYWNAVGLSAAMGVICCLWLGARRSGHALLRALAYPAVGLLLSTLVLSYSRGALAALAIGLLLWFGAVPLRLRSAALLIVGGLGAAALIAWDFSQNALTAEAVPLAERTSAGHQLGALLLAMLVALTLAGVAIGFITGRAAPSSRARRRAGAALCGAIVLAVLALVGALAHSQRGFTGTISHDLGALTNPNAKPPPNTAGRLTAVASVRARYWKEALQVFKAHPALGAGAEGYRTAHLRYETETLQVRHAHGFVVQTLADLGLAGLALMLALLVTWMVAAGRATHPFNRSWRRRSGTGRRAWRELRAGALPRWRRLQGGELSRYTPERIGLLAMLCVVVVFGAHSFVDWTWYVPGDACVALLCAGWLAGRGPLLARSGQAGLELRAGQAGLELRAGSALEPVGFSGRARQAHARAGNMRVTLAGAAIVAALLAAWSQWQPLRSEEATQQALALLASDHPHDARASADSAVSRDPLSVEALSTLARVQQVSGEPARARATLERAVRLQPSNWQTWLTLGRYQLTNDPAAALRELQAAIYLDPESIAPEAIANGQREAIEIHNQYIQALQAAAAASTRAAAAASTRAAAAASTRAAAAASTRPTQPARPASARISARRAAARPRALARLRSAIEPRVPATAGARQAVRRLRELELARTRTRRSAR